MATLRSKSNIDTIYPLSALQQGLLFHALQAGSEDPYLYQSAFELRGVLDRPALERAWAAVVAKYPVLRSDYRWEEIAQPLQIVYREGSAEIEWQDWRDPARAEQEQALVELLAAERAQGFDFRRAADPRLRCLRLADDEYRLVWSYHHIALDGWSLALVMRDLLAGYREQLQGRAPPLAPARPYRDYIRWLQQQDATAGRAYWRQLLAGVNAATPLPFLPQPASEGPRYAELAVQLSTQDSERLRRCAALQQLTLNTLVQGAWALLLGRQAGSDDVVFGCTVSGRPPDLAGAEDIAGLFINTLPLRVALPSAQPLSAWLQRLQAQNAEQRQFEYLPLAEVQGVCELAAGQALFESILVFENYPVDVSLAAPQGQLAVRYRRRELADGERIVTAGRNNYALSLIAIPGECLELRLAYDCRRLAHDSVAAMGQQLRQLLQAFCRDPAARLGAIGLCDATQQAELRAVSAGPLDAATFRALPELIAAHAAATPEAVALLQDDQTLSYAELERRANRLARLLQQQGVTAEQPVALCLPRSLDFVVAVLAIWKAGGYYVPLDPQAPPQRRQDQLADCGARLLIGAGGLDLAAAADQSDAPLPVSLHPQQCAYLIYTSGSTGRPKGVAVSHGALANYLRGVLSHLPLDDIQSFGWLSTPAADLGHTVLFGALAAGRRLLVLGEEHALDAERLAEALQRHAIDALKLVPSHLGGLLQALEHPPLPRRCMILGGEAAGPALLERVRSLAPQLTLLNHYGPTETTVGVLTHRLDAGAALPENRLPLGRPLANVCAYVLDADLNPLPPGVPGELYLGGAQLARGYHGRPDITAERFLPDPYGAPGARVYRSGDQACLRADGRLDYLGRVDEQLKIRGYRVEPGELAEQLRREPGVRDAAVIAEGVPPRLVGYVAADAGLDLAALKQRLAQRLPEYLLPAQLVLLKRLPLNANGKLDRRALPSPDAVPTGAKLAPRNAVEATLAAIWCEVLKLETVGVEDNFFELGGDSILALQIIARARAQKLKLTPKQLFEHQTIAALAAVATPLVAKAAPVPSSSGGELPLTPIQHWFFEQALVQPQHWNQALMLELRAPLDSGLLSRALDAVAAQHEALRLRFRGDTAVLAATVPPLAVRRLDLAAVDPSERPEALAQATQALQAGFDLANGPLIAALQLKLDGGRERLLLAIHHLVVDGVSWRVLLEDLDRACRQLQADQAPQLPAPTTGWKDWASRLQAHAQNNAELQTERRYWQTALQPMLLPARDPQGGNSVGDSRRVESALNREETEALLRAAPAAYRTQINDLLLTALAQLLCRWSGTAHALIELEGHGREELAEGQDLSRTVGWFTTRFPVCLTPAVEPGAAIRAVKEQLRALPSKGLGYGLLRYLGDADTRASLAALPQPQFSFNYLGQLDAATDGSLFRLVPEPVPGSRASANARRHWLDVVGQVVEGRLQLAWTYSPAIHAPAEIEQLAQDYLAALRALIAHCLATSGGATPADFPLARVTQAELDRLPLSTVEDIYPLTPLQQGLLFHSLYAPQADVYVNQLQYTLRGRFAVEAFHAAWNAVVARHAVLRTAFHWQREGEALQIVQRAAVLPFEQLDWGALRPAEHAARLAQFLAEDRARGFELERAPLMRVTLIARHDGATEFIWTKHHLLLDGWSSAGLLQEVLEHYRAASEGRRPALPVPGRYRDYLAWLQRQPQAAAESYWRAQLARLSGPLQLAETLPPPDVAERGHGALELSLPPALSAALQAFAQRHHVTLNTLLQAAWALLLARYSGRRDVVFGVTVAGRPAELAGVESTLGLFINTLPLVLSVDPERRLDDWLQALQAHNSELRQYEATPLAEIQRWQGAGQPLFDSLLVFENYPLDASLRQPLPELSVDSGAHHHHTHYALTLTIVPGERLRLDFGYERARFGDETVARLAAQLQQLLQGFLQHENPRLRELPLLPADEYRRVTAEWNATAIAYPDLRPVHKRIAAQAAATPEAIALVFEGQALSYRALDAASNRLAHRLIAEGIKPDSRVGLCAERSPELVVGLLAILKAGAAYVPLDPDYPRERLAHMLDDAGIGLLLTQSALWSRLELSRANLRVLALDADPGRDQPADAPALVTHPQQLAYLIYTSGSTGQPKGAGLPHTGLINRLLWMQQAYPLTAADRVLQKTPFSFDVSVWEFLWPLLQGATLVVAAPGIHKDPMALAEVIRREQISTLHFVPSMLQAFVDAGELPSCSSLRQVMASGEALPAPLAARFREQTTAALHNLYGPTEASIDVTAWTCSAANTRGVPIGWPIANTQIHLLDAQLNPVPIGVAGELYIGGVQLARGYHARPALTAERFVPDPYGPPGSRLYRSGDLARWREDGAIDYLGRIDHQVKLRGLRIELGEIEAALLGHPGLREAVVLAREDRPGDRRLVAYVVGASPSAEELRRHLQLRLPDYMIPSAYVTLDALPLSPNGKLDRKALPAPELPVHEESHVAPRTPQETALAQIWAEVLNVPRVGVYDNFFALGGHSLLAIQVVSRLAATQGLKLGLAELFQRPTIAELAEALHAKPVVESTAVMMALLDELE